MFDYCINKLMPAYCCAFNSKNLQKNYGNKTVTVSHNSCVAPPHGVFTFKLPMVEKVHIC